MKLSSLVYFGLSAVTVLLFMLLPEHSAIGAALICWSFFALPGCLRLATHVTTVSPHKDLVLHRPASHVAGLLQGMHARGRRLEHRLSGSKSKILLVLLTGLAAVIMVRSLAPAYGFSLQQAGFLILLAVSFWGAQTLPAVPVKIITALGILGGSVILLMAFASPYNMSQAHYGALFMLWSLLSLAVSQVAHKPKSRSIGHRYLMQI